MEACLPSSAHCGTCILETLAASGGGRRGQSETSQVTLVPPAALAPFLSGPSTRPRGETWEAVIQLALLWVGSSSPLSAGPARSRDWVSAFH